MCIRDRLFGRPGAIAGGVGVALAIINSGAQKDREAEFNDQQMQFSDAGCGSMSELDATCQALESNLTALADNANQHRQLIGVGWGIAGGGVALLGGGIGLFIVGKKRTDDWKAGEMPEGDGDAEAKLRLRLVPQGQGLALHGRF